MSGFEWPGSGAAARCTDMKTLRSALLGLAPLALSILVGACAPTESADIEAASAEGAILAASAPATACEALSPRAKPLELFVFPDVGTAPFVDAIGRATRSIDVMVYLLGTGAILDGLVAKAAAGVKVRVILDLSKKSINERYKAKLEAAGATVIWSDPQFTFMHAKFMLVDDAEAIVSTGNYGESFMLRERNYAVRDTDAADVATMKALFEADFARTAPDLSCTRLLVAPINARQRLLDFIASAKTSIAVESMQLGDDDVREALAARKDAGVDVRAILADPSWIDANASAGTFLKEHGIPAKYREGVHAKAIVVDGAVAYVGSINLSWNSITNNREVGLLVTEPANIAAMSATFESDWAIGTAF